MIFTFLTLLPLMTTLASDPADFVLAIRTRDAATVESMLAADPQLAGVTSGGRSAVSIALFTFDENNSFMPPQRNEVLHRLLARKPRLDVYETAAVGGAAELQQLLRDDPAAVSKASTLGWTPLHYAAFGGNTAAIEVLVRAGANVHARATNRFRNTPLIVATLNGQLDAAKLLLASGADVLDRQAHGFTALHEAAFTGKLELVRLYVEQGAELNSRTDDGRTPLSEARRGKHEAVAKFLESKGALAGPTGLDLLSSPE